MLGLRIGTIFILTLADEQKGKVIHVTGNKAKALFLSSSGTTITASKTENTRRFTLQMSLAIWYMMQLVIRKTIIGYYRSRQAGIACYNHATTWS
jgi:hypothetical protein